MTSALEELKALKGHMAEGMTIASNLDEERNWLMIENIAERTNMERGETNELGKVSNEFAKAKGVYSDEDK